ncbi:MAG: hypothetical protein GX495_07560 [Chloroflexi bacterium]|jgi:predicted type IV restriction endonuclease|nr:hypothetical protein [Chloroflexota bacterium]
MKSTSPLAAVVKVLQHVRKNARAYSPLLSKNEAATRSALVDPVLRALGWDLGNPFAVEFERSFMDTRVDYALSNCQNQVKVIVEAKALGGRLDDKKIILSLVSYAFTYGLQDIFLTNGLIWEHFSDFQPGKVTANRTLDLSNDDLVECAEYLVHRLDAAIYWPVEEEASLSVSATSTEKQMEELTRSLIALQTELGEIKAKLAQNLKTELEVKFEKSSEPVRRDQNFTALEDLPRVLTGKPAPHALRLPDGSIVPVNSWSSILLECVKYALKHNPSIQIPLPDRAGKKVHLIKVVAPDKQIRCGKVNFNGRPVYIHLNYDSNDCISNAIYILQMVPRDAIKVPAAVEGIYT